MNTIDEGIEILTGMTMGQLSKGQFQKNTISFKVDQNLREMARKLKEYSGAGVNTPDEHKKAD
jgi:hypothetical protein